MRWNVVFPAFLLAAACDEPNVHILTALVYEPAGACVTASQGVDVVNGPSTGDNCNPTCLTIASSGTTSVYVTTICPPFPLDYAVEAEDAATDAGDPCIGAFAAYADFLDSGVNCPPITDDGGDEAGEGGMVGDAGADGGTDAAGDAPATD
jgi:hypothetical protein